MIHEISSSISFGAKFVRHADIGKHTGQDGQYAKEKASFVKIDTNCADDVKALYGAAQSWTNEKYANTIYWRAKDMFDGVQAAYGKIFALTSQQEKFKKLDPDKIFGMVEVEELNPKVIHLSHIQVKPDFIYTETPEYKGVGTAMINCLKDLYKGIFLTSLRERSVRNFYEKNGFRLIDLTRLKYHWSAYLRR